MDEWTNTLGLGSIYGFFESQSILNAKDKRQECQQYIEKWVKESQKQFYLGAYLNLSVKYIYAFFVNDVCVIGT